MDNITNLQMDPNLADALTALEVARNHLDQAEAPDMVEAACYEITAAELRVRAVIKQARSGRTG